MEQQNTYHFAVMRRAIDYIDEATDRPLSLNALAAEMNMSPAHFQRLFSQWVGVSPNATNNTSPLITPNPYSLNGSPR